MEKPDFGLDEEPGGIVSDYSDGVPMISYALVDADGGILRAYDAERPYYSASTVKMGVMVAALREVQRGNWSLDDEHTVTHEFTSIVPGAGRFVMPLEDTDPGVGSPGDTVTLSHLLDRMTGVSANCATNILFEALGPEAVASPFLDAGVPDTGMDRPYSDARGLAEGYTNRATALGLARFVAAIARGDLLDEQQTAKAKQLMRNRQNPVIGGALAEIGARAGKTIDHGSKGGGIEGIAHDVAFLERDGETRCLAICTRAYGEEQGEAAIRALATALLGEWATAG